MKLSFGFAKKAEPKRVVAALNSKPKADEGHEVITEVTEGEVKIDGADKAARALVIPCKNSLDDLAARKAALDKVKPKAAVQKPAVPMIIDETVGGLVVKNLDKLSEEDAEAMRELLKDAQKDPDDESHAFSEMAAATPILMRAGSKRAREGGGDSAYDMTRDGYEKVPVEAFGEALLRGMGYDPEKHKVKPVYHEKPRDQLLGLGAKALLPSEKLKGKGAGKKGAPEPLKPVTLQ
ncbi:unnamed protein product, partial [Polarella glacialis]